MKSRGTTLIETLIYIALFLFIIGGVMVATYQIIQTVGGSQNKTLVESEGNFLLQKIDWVLTNVSAINSPPAGPPASTLSVNKLNFASNPLVLSFSDGVLWISRGGSAPAKLSGAQIVLTSVLFEHIAAAGSGPEAVKASFTLSYMGFSQDFSTIKYLRK